MTNEGIDLLQSRIARIVALVDVASRRTPGEGSPCFAHVRVRTKGRERDVLFGPRPLLDRELTVLDARSAPLAALLYGYEVGEAYELEVGDEGVEGTLLERHRLEVERGRLVRIEDDAAALVRDASERFVPAELAGGLRPADPALDRRSASFDVPLDEVQRAAVEAEAGEPMLVLGEAGAGKTTVALHRLVRLARASRLRAAYVAPTEGLARWVSIVLERASIDEVEVIAFDDLAVRLARRSFRRLPSRVERDAPAAVIRLKRHRALLAAIERLAAQRACDEDGVPLRADREDLLRLFGDHDAMRAIVAGDGALRASDVDVLLEHLRAQFRTRTEDDYADVVDASRLAALDGRSLDSGTPSDAAGRIDVEDFPVLFELARVRAERRGAREALPERFDALVVDEAQELAPLELRLLGRLLTNEGSLIVAGDDAQRTDDSASFVDFETTLADLGAGTHRRVELATSYRCPERVATLARAIRRGEPGVVGADEVVRFERFTAEVHEAMRIAQLLRQILAGEGAPTVVVATRDASGARRWHRTLGGAFDLVLAERGAFDFHRRLHVAQVAELRGLEFDYVFVPDASAAAYPRDDDARRALYVATTRACRALWLGAVGSITPLLSTSPLLVNEPPRS